MKVPKHIQNKMRQATVYFQKGQSLMRQIDAYFIDQGCDMNVLRCGNGCSLEEIEYGNDITDKFVEEAENDFSSEIWV